MALPRHMMPSLRIGGSLALFTALIAVAFFSWTDSILADDTTGPWECSGYSGDAHTRCLQAFIEVQREKISTLEGEVSAQRGSVNQLKEQVDRQGAVTADIQRQLSETSQASAIVPSVPYYTYPPVGIGLYLGSPWYYGSSYFYRPYFGPRFFFGPRFLGPRYFGSPYFGSRYFRHCRGRC